MQRIITASKESDTLIAAGEVIELRFVTGKSVLSLRSAKLLHLLVDLAGEKASSNTEHSALISQLNFSHLEADDLLDNIRELQQTLIEFTYKDEGGELRVKSSSLLSMVDRAKELSTTQGTIRYKLSETLRDILTHSDHWAALSRDAVLAFESRYALRLYELIALRANLKHKSSETFDLEDLKRRLGVPPGKLVRWSNFKQSALDPAIAEVNQLTAFNVSYSPERRGRSMERVSLSWAHVSFAPSPRPHAKTSSNTINDYIKNAFPMHGGLKHGQQVAHWRDLAEKHAKRLQGGHLPDLSELANQFRTWCAHRDIPLDASSIEKTFIGFCEKYRPPNSTD